jgi:hypothetical protein
MSRGNIMSGYDVMISERNLLVKVYKVLDATKLSVDYEGDISQRGDMVYTREDKDFIIDKVIEINGKTDTEVIRVLCSKINWLTTEGVIVSIINHQLIWGSI